MHSDTYIHRLCRHRYDPRGKDGYAKLLNQTLELLVKVAIERQDIKRTEIELPILPLMLELGRKTYSVAMLDNALVLESVKRCQRLCGRAIVPECQLLRRQRTSHTQCCVCSICASSCVNGMHNAFLFFISRLLSAGVDIVDLGDIATVLGTSSSSSSSSGWPLATTACCCPCRYRLICPMGGGRHREGRVACRCFFSTAFNEGRTDVFRVTACCSSLMGL